MKFQHLIFMGLILIATPALAQPPAEIQNSSSLYTRFRPLTPQTLTQINQYQASRHATTLHLFAGRNSAIQFRTGETIQFIQISDPSVITFLTNAPIESRQATVIVLRLIRPLKFPGVITTANPNLTVVTNQNTYFFNLQPSYRTQNPSEANGVSIVSGSTLAMTMSGEATISTRYGQATVDDIQRGLAIAIRRGYTRSDDPIVTQVKQALMLMQRSNTTLPEIAESMQSPQLPKVLTRLGELGLQNINTTEVTNPESLPASVLN